MYNHGALGNLVARPRTNLPNGTLAEEGKATRPPHRGRVGLGVGLV